MTCWKIDWLDEDILVGRKKRRNVLILHLEIINILGMSDAWSGIYMKINERTALINF